MALINCYECGTAISDKAQSCPHCGAPVEEIIEDIIPISEETEILRPNAIEERIIVLRDIPVILDSDVAFLYGVETKEVNQAVKNNPRKFPEGFIIETNQEEKTELVKNFDRFNRLKHSAVFPAAFTEQGLYMLATILKGEKAEETTINIIQTFTRIRQLSRTISQVIQEPDEAKKKSLMKKGGELIGQILDNDLELAGTETSFEVNLAVMKLKHTAKYVKKTKKPE
jgi:RNA polymerase subunit RPABC4/transcription elongation factor Spt4